MVGEGVEVVDDMAEGWRLVVAWLEDGHGAGAWRDLVGVGVRGHASIPQTFYGHSTVKFQDFYE